MNFNHIIRSKFDHFINDPLPRDTYYLIDNFSTISCGHSLRKLSSTASKCIRVRRSSDNAETDVFFAGDYLDIAGMLNWSGSDSVYVTTWYNQYDSNHLIQTSNTKQPRIVNAGTVDTQDNKPCIVFDGSNDNFEWTTDLNVEARCCVILLTPSGTIGAATAGQLIFDGSNGTTRTLMSFGSTTTGLTNERISYLISNPTIYGQGYTSADVSGRKILAFETDGTGALTTFILMNGVELSLATHTNGAFLSGTRQPKIIRYLGSSTVASGFFSGNVQEVIINTYRTSFTSVNANMNDYYAVY